MEKKFTLKEMAYILLDMWYNAEDAFIWEFSEDIKGEEERLEAKFKDLQKKIEEASK